MGVWGLLGIMFGLLIFLNVIAGMFKLRGFGKFFFVWVGGAIFIFTFIVSQPEGEGLTFVEFSQDPFGKNHGISVVDDETIYNCSVFTDSGSKVYLESKYGDDNFCEIKESGLSWEVLCRQGTFAYNQDLNECEVLTQW